jgi:drug/metabolite transporter (DMT)-like permease
MLNSLLFAAVVLIWGSAWIMVKFQIGVVPPEVSVAYRMGSAAAIMFAWSLLRPKPRRLTGEDHLFMALQGALIFSTNFFLFYLAAATLTTGSSPWYSPPPRYSPSASKCSSWATGRRCGCSPAPCWGLSASVAVFWPQVAGLTAAPGAGTGLLLSIGGTLSFSLGGIVSARNQAHGLSGQVCTAWAMAYGAVLLSLFAMAMGSGFTFDLRVSYIGSLLYLSLIGSVLGFACYFALLRRIQAERAAYATVLFPIVALFLSTLFEDYRWTLMAFGGIGLTLIGNVLVLGKPRATASPRRK